MNAPYRILIVDSAPETRRQLRESLPAHGYECLEATDAEAALTAYGREKPVMVVLDPALPGEDGFDVVRDIRKRALTPIVILSARDDPESKVHALELGANDYVTKPFHLDELLSHLRVALRQGLQAMGRSPVFRSGPLTVDLLARRALLDGGEIHLSPMEFGLLRFLIIQAGRVVTYRQILEELWGPTSADDVHYVRVLVSALRRKIEPGKKGQVAQLIATEFGVGYRLLLLPSLG